MIEILGAKAASAKQLEEYQREQATVDALTAHTIKILPLAESLEKQAIRLEPPKESTKNEGSKGLMEKDASEELVDFGSLEGVGSSLLERVYSSLQQRPLKLARANNPESYWRPQLLEVAAERWCNGKDRQIRAGLKQVALMQRCGRKQMKVYMADCDMPGYIDLLCWLARFQNQLATPQE